MTADTSAGPVGHGLAGQLGAIVAAQHGRVAAPGGDAVQFVEEVLSGNGALDQAAEALGAC